MNELIDMPIGTWGPAGRAFIEPMVINGKVYVAYSVDTHTTDSNQLEIYDYFVGVCY